MQIIIHIRLSDWRNIYGESIVIVFVKNNKMIDSPRVIVETDERMFDDTDKRRKSTLY